MSSRLVASQPQQPMINVSERGKPICMIATKGTRTSPVSTASQAGNPALDGYAVSQARTSPSFNQSLPVANSVISHEGLP